MKIFDCELYMDLMPLVKDGAASEASQRAVANHLAQCESCRALYDSLPDAPPSESEATAAKTLAKLRRSFYLGLGLVALLGALAGLSLGTGVEMFYNVLLLPAVGMAAYFALRRRSWLAPVGLWALAFVWFCFYFWFTGEFRLGGHGDTLWPLIASAIGWGMIYALFCAFGVCLGGLFHLVFAGAKKLPQVVRILAGTLAVGLVLGVLYFANGLVGNPICKAVARHHAQQYIAQTYPDQPLVIGEVTFDFKFNGYYVRISHPSSADTRFSLRYNAWGQFSYDSYQNEVADGGNTYRRLDNAYRTAVDQVLEETFGQVHIGYGRLNASNEVDAFTPWLQIPALDTGALRLDGQYDLDPLGAQYGEVVLYLEDTDVTVERAAQLLLQTRRAMDGAGVTFYRIAFVLQHPRNSDGIRDNHDEIRVTDFLYADIYEDGMVERVQAAHDALTAWYARQDAEKAAWELENRED